jgi:DNA/RNA endonuclease YhcR with UshA esterase domain
MRFRAVGSLGVALGVLLATAQVSTHHSFSAEYDIAKPVTLKGLVTKVEWMNPHTFFFINVKDESGKVTNWALEMGAPSALQKQGWTRNTLQVGDEVTVEGSLARNGSNLANASAVYRSGKKLGAASSSGQSN